MKIELDIPDDLRPFIELLQSDLWNERSMRKGGGKAAFPSHAEAILHHLDEERRRQEHHDRQAIIDGLIFKPGDIPF